MGASCYRGMQLQMIEISRESACNIKQMLAVHVYRAKQLIELTVSKFLQGLIDCRTLYFAYKPGSSYMKRKQ